tara:strand:- start:1042 stop:2109 length:1068 start_codon:yes stop_codon:yes gene_type:complete
MRFLKILLINLIVFLFGLSFIELSLRTYLSIKHFNNPNVSYWGKTWYRLNPIKFVKFDEKLKFTLTPNIAFKNVDLPRWERNSNITINDLGFRDNENFFKKENEGRILTVGDSFTFGSQVTDQNTWQSCLEKKLKIRIDNGGVPGYSAGQSVKKALIETKKRNYSHIIWSIYFRDFRRDVTEQILIKKNNGQIIYNKFDEISDKKKMHLIEKFFFISKEYFFIIYYFDEKFLRVNLSNGKKAIDKKIDNSKNKIIIENAKYLIKLFNSIPVKNKIILFQYGHIKNSDNEKNNPELYDIKILKDLIVKYSKNYPIQIIDTEEVISELSEIEKELLWFDHHTAEGNKMVCDLIVKKM